MLIRSTALPFLLAVQVTPVADLQNPSVRRGHTLVEAACAACHALGRFDATPWKSAPPLREVHKRYPVEDLAEALAEGLITGHPSGIVNLSRFEQFECIALASKPLKIRNSR